VQDPGVHPPVWQKQKHQTFKVGAAQRRETKADTLKQLRPIGEGDQELEKRLVQEELT
jgi:hypothetical protein